MSIFEEDTISNPLYLENVEGLDASFDQAVFMDDTDEFLAKKRAKRAEGWSETDEYDEEVDYA